MSLYSKTVHFFNQKLAQKPLTTILIIALILRLVAAIFARGYGMHDDHFLVIEASQSWVDGTDYNNWLPKNRLSDVPDGHSFFYVGIHYVLFSVIKWLGIHNPDTKMYIIRILHALLSLLVVWGGYKIARQQAGERTAKRVGIFLAMLWFMPFLSVRNLVEIVAMPFLMWGLWLIYAAKEKRKYLLWMFLAGFVMGLAVSIRFQAVLFVGGTGLALLFLKKWKEAIHYSNRWIECYWYFRIHQFYEGNCKSI